MDTETNLEERPAPVPTPPPAASRRATPVTTDFAVIRERDRLLTLANVQRMRGQTGDARKTLEEVIAMSEGLPPRDISPTYELLGDLNEADEKWDAALEAYRKAHEIDKARVGAERKFAALTLRMADIKAEKRLAEAMLRGENVADLMATGALATQRGRRNGGVAMLLSAVIPGFGQFYNGEFIKGAILLAINALGLLYFAMSADREMFLRKFIAIITVSHPRYASAPVSSLSVIMGVLLVADWLYAIVDAPFIAAKTPANDVGPTIDKTGWEV